MRNPSTTTTALSSSTHSIPQSSEYHSIATNIMSQNSSKAPDIINRQVDRSTKISRSMLSSKTASEPTTTFHTTSAYLFASSKTANLFQSTTTASSAVSPTDTSFDPSTNNQSSSLKSHTDTSTMPLTTLTTAGHEAHSGMTADTEYLTIKMTKNLSTPPTTTSSIYLMGSTMTLSESTATTNDSLSYSQTDDNSTSKFDTTAAFVSSINADHSLATTTNPETEDNRSYSQTTINENSTSTTIFLASHSSIPSVTNSDTSLLFSTEPANTKVTKQSTMYKSGSTTVKLTTPIFTLSSMNAASSYSATTSVNDKNESMLQTIPSYANETDEITQNSSTPALKLHTATTTVPVPSTDAISYPTVHASTKVSSAMSISDIFSNMQQATTSATEVQNGQASITQISSTSLVTVSNDNSTNSKQLRTVLNAMTHPLGSKANYNGSLSLSDYSNADGHNKTHSNSPRHRLGVLKTQDGAPTGASTSSDNGNKESSAILVAMDTVSLDKPNSNTKKTSSQSDKSSSDNSTKLDSSDSTFNSGQYDYSTAMTIGTSAAHFLNKDSHDLNVNQTHLSQNTYKATDEGNAGAKLVGKNSKEDKNNSLLVRSIGVCNTSVTTIDSTKSPAADDKSDGNRTETSTLSQNNPQGTSASFFPPGLIKQLSRPEGNYQL